MKTRKLLAIMLAVALLASFFTVPVLAEGEGEMLEVIGILEGPGEDGVTADYLATLATRAQAALVDLRLDGTAADAESFDGEETFTDAADATEFWQPILEYLKATPEAGWNGYPDGSFDPTGTITGMEFTKVLVVDLGYVEGVDFEYADVMEFAASLGLTALADMADEALTMGDIAAAIVEVLGTKTTAATDITLVSQLVLDGVVDADDAETAGFVVEEPALLIVSAAPTATTEVTVEMSTDVPEGTAVTLKKGPSGYNVTAAIDGSTIVLTASYDLPAGDWTVTVGEESADFTIEEQTATGFSFGTDVVYDSGEQDLMVSLVDQYGDAMNLTGITYSIFNTATGYVYTPTEISTTLKFNIDDSMAEEDNEINVFVYDSASGESASYVYAVMETPYLAGLEVGEVTLGDDEATRLYEGTEGNVIAVTAWDQYEQPYTLTNSDVDLSQTYPDMVHIISSNNSVISAGAMYVNDDGNIVFETGVDGYATITLIIPETSFIAQTDMIQVWATAELTELMVGGLIIPEEQVGMFAWENAELDVVGIDQYGDEIAYTATDDIHFTVTNPSVIDDVVLGDDTVTVYAGDEGSSVVYVFLGGQIQDQVTITVDEAAYPFKVSCVDVAEALQTGVSTGIDSDDVSFEDQYGRSIDLDGTWTWTTDVDTDEESVALTTGAGFATFDTMGLEPGSDTFTVYLVDNGTVVNGNSCTFDMKNVAASEIDGLTVAEETVMYTGYADTESDDYFDVSTWGQTPDQFYKTLDITGTADGLGVVLLDTNADGRPDIVDFITSSNDAVEVVSGSLLIASDDSDTDTTIKVWRDGEVQASTVVDLCVAAPDLAVIGILDDAEAWDDWDTTFTYTDQYGVTMSGSIVVAADTPDGLISGGYTVETTHSDDDYNYWTVIKWDGTISKTFAVAIPE